MKEYLVIDGRHYRWVTVRSGRNGWVEQLEEVDVDQVPAFALSPEQRAARRR